MNYNEVHIRQADAALGIMKENTKLTDGHKVRQAMAEYGDPYLMVDVMRYDLKLIVCNGDRWALTYEGKKAASMGFEKYLRYLKFKECFAFWGPVVSIAAAVVSIIGAVVSWFS